MIPSVGANDVTILTERAIPTRTYRMDFEKGVVSGKTDGIEAMKQAIHLILSTERFIWPIFSWNYGIEAVELIGKRRFYVESELQRRVTDALMQDDRVISVGGFAFEEKKQTLSATFTVNTTEGEVEASKEVGISV